ncbi:hypothetical protein ACGFNU_02020 [Spirillospora sp. NPDC048911]|uniref:hypothetical protein n=1 Tax=Spirillospora sp. NPDC048911 TaxID=3364527 RepID=UPI003714F1BA
MQTWRLTYAVNDGSGMFGLEPAKPHTVEVELPTEDLARTGEDEQRILEMMRAAVREKAGEAAILTDAEEIAS